jgi:hypothetical protein
VTKEKQNSNIVRDAWFFNKNISQKTRGILIFEKLQPVFDCPQKYVTTLLQFGENLGWSS